MRPGRSSGPRRRILAAVAVAGLFVLPVITPGSAGADPIADKRAEATQIAAKLDALNAKVDKLADQYNQATAELDQADAAVTGAQHQVDRTNAELAEKTKQLRSFAVQAYVTGNDNASFEAILTSTAADATQKRSYLEAASGSRQDLIGELQATKQRVADQMAQLTTTKQQAQQVRDTISNARSEADAAVAEQQQIQSNVQGDLATLVAAEQQRQTEARAAAAAAQAAAAEAAQQAAQKATPPVTAPVALPVTPKGDPKPPTTIDPGPGTPGAGAAIAAAQSALGVPYVWAGASMSGFDCSGLTMWAWAHAGRSLPHSSSAQYAMTRHIALSQLLPGDLVFFDGLGHEGLYIGGGMMIHAPHTGDVVRVASIYSWSTPLAGRL